MWFEQSIEMRLLSNVTRSADGCAFFLAQAAEAEAAGEALVFKRLEDHAPDKLKRLIKHHHDDERRHAALLRDAALGCGSAWPVLSPELNMVHVLDRALGGHLLSGPIRSDRAAIEIYLIMEMLERRAARELGLLAGALARAGRPEHVMLNCVQVDEERHVLYCRAALRLYGHQPSDKHCKPSGVERELRAEVARAFGLYDHSTLNHLLETGLLGVDLSRLERFAWRAVAQGLALKVGLGRLRTRGRKPSPPEREASGKERACSKA